MKGGLKVWLQRKMPSAESLRANKWLRWLGPSLHHPRLWHMNRRGIAAGLAIGLFFGLLLPTAQIPCSAGLAIVLRANLPLAVAGTLVTNPVTSVPLYYAAWRLGSVVLGEPAVPPARGLPGAAPAEEAAPRPGLGGWLARAWERLCAIGKPLALGLALLATGSGLLAYLLVSWIWRARVSWVWRRRRRRQAA
ncbi:MAG TPA: DUF2062 domain-containing protein [Burkholderiaceae bacterium]|nr:DUF2062 domain-containing protein [Burkholderiaceae bacterium]